MGSYIADGSTGKLLWDGVGMGLMSITVSLFTS